MGVLLKRWKKLNWDPAKEWDERYQISGHNLAKPRPFLQEYLNLLPEKGWALDVAMGEGHNANLLSQRGLKVLGVDISRVALKKALKEYPQIRVALINLPQINLPESSLDVILNFWFLDRDMFPLFDRFLKPGGYLMFETMRSDDQQDQSHVRKEFLLQPDELYHSFTGWEIIVYDENVMAVAKGKPQLATRMLARKPSSKS